jgi:hypothetical protein
MEIVSYKLQLDSSSIATSLQDRLLLQHLKIAKKQITAKGEKSIRKTLPSRRCRSQSVVC